MFLVGEGGADRGVRDSGVHQSGLGRGRGVGALLALWTACLDSNPSSATCQPSDLLLLLISLCLSFLLCKMGDKNSIYQEFAGGSGVRTLDFHCCGPGSIPTQGN